MSSLLEARESCCNGLVVESEKAGFTKHADCWPSCGLSFLHWPAKTGAFSVPPPPALGCRRNPYLF